ncbi:MAG: hypothetical protein IPL84_13455 [Chitinophagaceae bacterium]|nr:hypothetical protein [Chitinophagaceae bacterium]
MTDLNEKVEQAKDVLNLEQKDMKKLPQMLNVLTILTYIGCALGAISAIWNYMSASTAYKAYEALGAMDNLKTENKALDSMLSGATDMVRKAYENRMMIMILALVGIALCFYGAMQMRNLKKQGFLIYVVGEILPIISFAVFIGFGGLFGGVAMIFTTLIAVVFIIMYATQRKALVN